MTAKDQRQAKLLWEARKRQLQREREAARRTEIRAALADYRDGDKAVRHMAALTLRTHGYRLMSVNGRDVWVPGS